MENKAHGKSLHSVRMAKHHLKKNNKHVYSNVYIQGTNVLPDNWYDYQYEDDALIILDESQLNYNCRDYSSKDKQIMFKKILTYLTMCRHYNIEIVFITQSINRLDVQIRDLSTDIIRFTKTYKIPYINFKKISLEWFPVLQKGRYFEDPIELEKYMNCSAENYDNFGRGFLKFVNPKLLKMYDTHIKDKTYLEKDMITKNIWKKEYVENGF